MNNRINEENNEFLSKEHDAPAGFCIGLRRRREVDTEPTLFDVIFFDTDQFGQLQVYNQIGNLTQIHLFWAKIGKISQISLILALFASIY